MSLNNEEVSKARMMTLAGDYRDALETLSEVLQRDPLNIEALRLRGNAIELMVLGSMIPVSIEDRASDLDLALASYEAILKIAPTDTLAIKDLADHYSNFRDKRQALALYSKLIDMLQKKEAEGSNVGDELRDVIENVEELRRSLGHS